MLVKIIIQFRICLKKNIIKQVKINKKKKKKHKNKIYSCANSVKIIMLHIILIMYIIIYKFISVQTNSVSYLNLRTAK